MLCSFWWPEGSRNSSRAFATRRGIGYSFQIAIVSDRLTLISGDATPSARMSSCCWQSGVVRLSRSRYFGRVWDGTFSSSSLQFWHLLNAWPMTNFRGMLSRRCFLCLQWMTSPVLGTYGWTSEQATWCISSSQSEASFDAVHYFLVIKHLAFML